jgi:hypothetical protein
VEKVIRGGKADDGRAFFVAGAGISIPGSDVFAVDLDGFATGPELLVTENGAQSEVVLRIF